MYIHVVAFAQWHLARQVPGMLGPSSRAIRVATDRWAGEEESRNIWQASQSSQPLARVTTSANMVGDMPPHVSTTVEAVFRFSQVAVYFYSHRSQHAVLPTLQRRRTVLQSVLRVPSSVKCNKNVIVESRDI